MKKANEEQVGGSHYKGMKIQPIDFIVGNNLGFREGNIIKYISRHQNKNGAEDLKKVIHYAQMILETEYAIDSEISYDNSIGIVFGFDYTKSST